VTVDMNGKQVKRIWWRGANGDASMFTEGQRTLRLSATHHGDRDEFWIVQYEDMIEVARHNCRNIATIEWC
jgi:hypothetical protein